MATPHVAGRTVVPINLIEDAECPSTNLAALEVSCRKSEAVTSEEASSPYGLHCDSRHQYKDAQKSDKTRKRGTKQRMQASKHKQVRHKTSTGMSVAVAVVDIAHCPLESSRPASAGCQKLSFTCLPRVK